MYLGLDEKKYKLNVSCFIVALLSGTLKSVHRENEFCKNCSKWCNCEKKKKKKKNLRN